MPTPPRLAWQKSSYSVDGNNCIELASAAQRTLHLRESDDPTTVLTTTPTRLQALLCLTRTHSL